MLREMENIKYRAKFAAILAAMATVVYFVLQLLFGADAGEGLVRCIFFFVVIFVAGLVPKWETMGGAEHPRPPPVRKRRRNGTQPPDV